MCLICLYKVAKLIEVLKAQTELEQKRVDDVAHARPPVNELRELTAFERQEPVRYVCACACAHVCACLHTLY